MNGQLYSCCHIKVIYWLRRIKLSIYHFLLLIWCIISLHQCGFHDICFKLSFPLPLLPLSLPSPSSPSLLICSLFVSFSFYLLYISFQLEEANAKVVNLTAQVNSLEDFLKKNEKRVEFATFSKYKAVKHCLGAIGVSPFLFVYKAHASEIVYFKIINYLNNTFYYNNNQIYYEKYYIYIYIKK